LTVDFSAILSPSFTFFQQPQDAVDAHDAVAAHEPKLDAEVKHATEPQQHEAMKFCCSGNSSANNSSSMSDSFSCLFNTNPPFWFYQLAELMDV
jgi:hypothetical protein